MKTTIPLLLLLPTAALAAATLPNKDAQLFAKRQGSIFGNTGGMMGEMANRFMQKATPFKIEEAPSTIQRAGVKRINIWYGPYTIKAKNSTIRTGNQWSMDPAGTSWAYLAEGVPRDITILKTNTTIVYADRTKADVSNGLYDHHVFMTNIDKPVPGWFTCSTARPTFQSLTPGSMFIGGSEDKYGGYYTTPEGGVNSGFYLGQNDKLVMQGDVINYTNEAKVVYTLNEIEYVPGKVDGMSDASMYVMVPGQCDGQLGVIFGKQEKVFTVKGSPLNVTRDGTILAFRGHLHDGGYSVIAKVNGKQVCESKAIYGGPGAIMGGGMGGHMRSVGGINDGPHLPGDKKWETIGEMSQCYGPIKVTKGDTVEMEAKYDMNLHPTREMPNGRQAEMMALAVVFFAVQ